MSEELTLDRLSIPTLDEIRDLEAAIRDCPQIAVDMEHHFAEGTYTRTMKAPKGALIVGKMHRHSCTNIVSQGSILVWSEESARRVDAPAIFTSPPGIKRVGLVLENVIWTTIHPNPDNEKNLDTLESAIICPEQQLNPPPRNPEIESRLPDQESDERP